MMKEHTAEDWSVFSLEHRIAFTNDEGFFLATFAPSTTNYQFGFISFPRKKRLPCVEGEELKNILLALLSDNSSESDCKQHDFLILQYH